MSRALYHDATLLDEQTGSIVFDDTSIGGQSNEVNRVYYEYAPGNSILVWQNSVILDIPDGSDNLDIATFIANNNPENRENITLRVLPGYAVGNLTIPNTIPSNLKIELRNFGEIQGNAGTPAQIGNPGAATNGQTALKLERPVTIINNGYIRGGGGAGGLGLNGYTGATKTAERIFCDHWWPTFDVKKGKFRGGWKVEKIDANTARLISPCKNSKIITMPDTGLGIVSQDVIVDSGVLDGTQYEVHTAAKDPLIGSVFVAVRIFSNNLVSYYTESITGLPGGAGGVGGKGIGFDNPAGPDLGEDGELGDKYIPVYPQGFVYFYAQESGYSGTWTVPAGVTEIKLYMVGYGGTGEDSTDETKGGWAGEFHVETHTVTTGDTYNWTLGNGTNRSGFTSFIGPEINITLTNGPSYSYPGSNTEAEMDDWNTFYIDGYDIHYGLPRKYHHGYPQNSHLLGIGGGQASIFGHGGSPIELSTSYGGIGAGGGSGTYGGRGTGGNGHILIKWNGYKELTPNSGEDGGAGGTGGNWGTKGSDGSPTIQNNYYYDWNRGTNPGYAIIGWGNALPGSIQGNINGQVLS